jgi:hypothetical protein
MNPIMVEPEPSSPYRFPTEAEHTARFRVQVVLICPDGSQRSMMFYAPDRLADLTHIRTWHDSVEPTFQYITDPLNWPPAIP